MDKASALERLLVLAREKFSSEALNADDDIYLSLGIDSVQSLRLLSEVEQAFGVEIPDYELIEVRTFDQLARVIVERSP